MDAIDYTCDLGPPEPSWSWHLDADTLIHYQLFCTNPKDINQNKKRSEAEEGKSDEHGMITLHFTYFILTFLKISQDKILLYRDHF